LQPLQCTQNYLNIKHADHCAQ